MVCGAVEQRTLLGRCAAPPLSVRARLSDRSTLAPLFNCASSSTAVALPSQIYQSRRATVFPRVTLCEDVEGCFDLSAALRVVQRSTLTAPDSRGDD